MTWSEVPFDGRIADVFGDGDRFVAVGAGSAGTSAWTSSDGRAWESHEVPEQSFGELPDGSPWTAAMGPIVRLGDTLYSFGATGTFNDASHGAGWRWTDGATWEAIVSPSDFFAGEVIAATASDDALVASTIAFGGGPRGTAGLWRWTPDTSWVRTSVSDEFVGALAWHDGTFLATEQAVGDGDQLSVWTATDGADWIEGAAPDGASEVCALTSAATGLVAVGRVGNRVTAWTTRDGAAWVESQVDAAMLNTTNPASAPVACRIVAADSGLIGVMQVGDTTRVWTSGDGASWQFQGTLQLSANSFGPFGNRVVLAAIGRHVILAGGRPDVLLVGFLEP